MSKNSKSVDLVNRYFDALPAIMSGNIDLAVPLALRELETLPQLAAAIPRHLKPGAYPPIEVLCQVLPHYWDQPTLEQVRTISEQPPFSEHRRQVAQSFDTLRVSRLTYAHVFSYPGCLQSELSKLISPLAADCAYWGARFKFLLREKHGRTYRLFRVMDPPGRYPR
jgi:hypothetical protein